MKILKYLLFILIPILLIYTLLCAIGPKDSSLTREIEISAPGSFAYNLVNNLENWQMWSAWGQMDTNMVVKYNEKVEGVGAGSNWISEVMGDGSMEIIESEENKMLKTQMSFDGWDGNSYGTWNFDTDNDRSKVSWSMSADAGFPFLLRGYMLVTGFKRNLKKQFDVGLANIKKICEARNKGRYAEYEISGIVLPEKHYVMSRAEVPMANIQQFYLQNLGSLFGKVQASKAKMEGMPSGLFFKRDELNQKMDMSAAIPVESPVEVDGAITFTIPEKNALQVDYYGDYNETYKAHSAIAAFLKDRKLLYDAPYIEEYVTDPGEEPNPAKWLTKITYYLGDSIN